MRLFYFLSILLIASTATGAEVLYYDSFDTPESIKRYNHWCPAVSGLKGFVYFTGKAYDASRLNAINSGLNAAAKYKDYYFKGKRADKTVELKGMTANTSYRVHEYQDRKFVTIFNCGKTDETVTLPDGAKITVKTMDFIQQTIK